MLIGLPSELFQTIVTLMEPSLEDWAAMRQVCRAWRDAVTLERVQQASIDVTLPPAARCTRSRAQADTAASWWSVHSAQLTGLRKLELSAPYEQPPATSPSLTALRWHVLHTQSRKLVSPRPLLNLTGLRSLCVHCGQGYLAQLSSMVFPSLVRLQLAARTACFESLQASATPLLQVLQLEAQGGLICPDFEQYTDLRRLCLAGSCIVGRYVVGGAGYAPITLAPNARLEVDTPHVQFLLRVLSIARHAVLYIDHINAGNASMFWTAAQQACAARHDPDSWHQTAFIWDLLYFDAPQPCPLAVTWLHRTEVHARARLSWPIMLWD